MWLRKIGLRCRVAVRPCASLKYRICEELRFLPLGRWDAGTEMSLASLVWMLKRAMKVLGSVFLVEHLARA
jgi:hypothetical protein